MNSMIMKRFLLLEVLLCLFCTTVLSQIAIIPGAERMDEYLPDLVYKRVAVCGNQTSLVGERHLVDTLLARSVNVVKIFCPEHGFRGEAEAGAHISSSVDVKTGVPIVSLYGKNKKPSAEQLYGIDVVVFDLQDVGCRFYTYISTLHYVMEAAAESGIKVIVLDRPNPNGYFIDGPVLDPKFRSFVGMHPVPVAYGMTIGEYAMMINGEQWLAGGIRCDLEVVQLDNYTHQSRYVLPVKPSPNLQSSEAIYLYPSLCFFEGTHFSVGRGTDRPFQIFGSPTLENATFSFTPIPIPGVSENPPCKGQKCNGFDLTEFASERLYQDNCLYLQFLLTAYQNDSRRDAFFTNADFFDKLAGTDQLRIQIQKGLTETEIRESWKEGLEQFKTVRAKYLLYE